MRSLVLFASLIAISNAAFDSPMLRSDPRRLMSAPRLYHGAIKDGCNICTSCCAGSPQECDLHYGGWGITDCDSCYDKNGCAKPDLSEPDSRHSYYDVLDANGWKNDPAWTVMFLPAVGSKTSQLVCAYRNVFTGEVKPTPNYKLLRMSSGSDVFVCGHIRCKSSAVSDGKERAAAFQKHQAGMEHWQLSEITGYVEADVWKKTSGPLQWNLIIDIAQNKYGYDKCCIGIVSGKAIKQNNGIGFNFGSWGSPNQEETNSAGMARSGKDNMCSDGKAASTECKACDRAECPKFKNAGGDEDQFMCWSSDGTNFDNLPSIADFRKRASFMMSDDE